MIGWCYAERHSGSVSHRSLLCCVIGMKVVLQNVVALPANNQRKANLILNLYSLMSMVVPSAKFFGDLSMKI